jgi:hypothetical protein
MHVRRTTLRLAGGLLAATLIASGAASAQGRGQEMKREKDAAREQARRPDVGDGHIPAHGPARSRDTGRSAPAGRQAPQQEQRVADRPGHPLAPHVHANGDQWWGHGRGHNDSEFRLEHPWQHGRFNGPIGARHVWRLDGGDRERFNVDGYFFQIAPYEYRYAGDWRWDRDDIVIYLDPDHDGWYLGYNVRLGTYLHVMFLGR